MAKVQQWRATYQDTLIKQEELRKKLDILINESRCIETDKEREGLFNLLGDSLLGEEKRLCIEKFIKYPSNTWCRVEDFGEFVREFLYIDRTSIPITFFRNQYGNEFIDISGVWKAIRRECFALFPRSLDKAIKMSKEMIQDRKKIRTVSTVKNVR